MSMCPACHTMDKGFFAPVCHSCNHEIGFFQQVTVSTIYCTVQIGCVVGFIAFIGWLF